MDILNEREQTHGDFAKVARVALKLKDTFRGGRHMSVVQIAGYAILVVRDLRRQGVAEMSGSDEWGLK